MGEVNTFWILWRYDRIGYLYDDGVSMVIYKYTIDATEQEFNIPLIKILDFQIQNNAIVFWAVVDDHRPKSNFSIKMIWTGQEPPIGYSYKKTIQDDEGLVWHIFMR